MSARSEVYLKDRQTGRLVSAVLLHGLTSMEVSLAGASWKPVVEARIQELEAGGASASQWPEHAHWDWDYKATRVEGRQGYHLFGIECDGAMQGLMLAATLGRACRIPSQRGRPLVYVDYLAAAPWNLAAFVEQPRYGLVGRVLVAAAIQLSVDQGFQGRVGLHSLPQAEPFYRACGMTVLAMDRAVQRLRYFEISPSQSARFLGQGGRE